MPKTKISEFSATPANNTDIDSINIAEGCAPSGINDAIRELMSQLKDFQTGAVGDSFNGPIGASTASTGAFTTLTTSSTVTHNGGTANGVTYLNGSKVLTSGSALTFDGTTLSNTGSGDRAKFGNGTRNIYIAGDTNGVSLLDGAAQTGNGWYINGASNYVAGFIGSSEQMRLTSTGLGIGTSSPAAKLDVVGSNGIRVNEDGAGTKVIQIRSNWAGVDPAINVQTNNNLLFATNGTERARIDSSGNLLVGTTSAGAKVYAVASGAQQAIRGDQSTAGAAAIYGTSSVNSGTGYVAYFTNSGSGTGLYISNTAAWQSTSDERLKTDIQDLDATARLLQLRPRDYLWKSQETSDEPNKRSFGFIAQEVKEVFPELVGVSPDGMFSVEYTGLIAPLVKAIQEQQAIIQQLQADVAALKGN